MCVLKPGKTGVVSGKTCEFNKTFGIEKTGALHPALEAKTYNLTDLYSNSTDIQDVLDDYGSSVDESMTELADKAVEAFREWWTDKYGHLSLSDIPSLADVKTWATTIIANAVDKLKPYFVLTIGGEGTV